MSTGGLKRRKTLSAIFDEEKRAIYITRSEWYELFFKERLSLVELICIKRTCTLFAKYEKLNALIMAHEHHLFGTVDKDYHRFMPASVSDQWNERVDNRFWNPWKALQIAQRQQSIKK